MVGAVEKISVNWTFLLIVGKYFCYMNALLFFMGPNRKSSFVPKSKGNKVYYKKNVRQN